jgi:hypothetical protein
MLCIVCYVNLVLHILALCIGKTVRLVSDSEL